MPKIPDPENQWYVVHVLSGQEQRVERRINREVEMEGLEDYVFQVLMPTEIISEVKSGQKRERKKKFFPGYVLVNANIINPDGSLVDKTFSFLKNLDGIIGFAGTKNKPIPMRQREVDAMLSQIQERTQESRPKIAFETGDLIKVNDGPFETQTGEITEIDMEKGMLKVSVSMFGRSTPVDLEFWQVEKHEE